MSNATFWSVSILTLAGAMFLLPMIIMIPAHLILGEVPDLMFNIGVWTMVLGIFLGGIGGVFTINGA